MELTRLTHENLCKKRMRYRNALLDASATYNKLDVFTKPLLARLAIQSKETSVALKEKAALASEEYKIHLEALLIAQADYARAKAEYEDFKSYIIELMSIQKHERENT